MPEELTLDEARALIEPHFVELRSIAIKHNIPIVLIAEMPPKKLLLTMKAVNGGIGPRVRIAAAVAVKDTDAERVRLADAVLNGGLVPLGTAKLTPEIADDLLGIDPDRSLPS
jgi:hypothetical protein